MSAGAVPYDGGGLDNFDPTAAAENLAAVGQQAAPITPPPAAAAPVQDIPQQGGVAPVGAHNPDLAGSTPASATAPAAGPPQPATIGPPPAPPALTGDPQRDTQQNLLYQRALTDYHGQLTARQTELDKHAAGVASGKADQELGAEREAMKRREEENRRFQEAQAQRQKTIDAEVLERSSAAKDLEGMKWGEPLTGRKLVAAIFGGIGQAYQNMAAIQSGHTPTAQNEALNTINGLMQKDYERRKQRLANASASLMEARYGFKDAADNHRAAMNDLDADTSAKYRLIAKEAESRLRQAGATEADVKGNAVVADALQKAAAAEAQIHEREEAMAGQRQHYKAEEALANANLGIARGHLSLSRDEMNLRHEDRAADREAKADAKKEKQAQSLDAMAVRDPDTGEPLGYAPTAKGVQVASDKLVAARAYSKALRDLADDIEQNGHVGSSLPIIGTEAGKRREEMHANAVARGRKALELGVSNANMQLEHSAVGGSGAGLSRIGSPAVLRRIADEQDAISAERLRSSLRPVNGERAARIPEPHHDAAAPGPAAANGFSVAGVRYEMGADGNYHKVK